MGPQDTKKAPSKESAFVPEAGIEPARYCYHWILNPARLPIPPLGQLNINAILVICFIV